MTTFFISDLHLQPQQPAVAEGFLRFMASTALESDTLYILGDFFEAWIGDDLENPFTLALISALKGYTDAGNALYFMHGNRDFLVGEHFAAQTGCQILEDPTLIDLYGKQALLMHGDTLCTADVDYLAFRQMVRNPDWQAEFLSKPLEERLAIAQNLRDVSKEKTGEKSYEIMDVTQDEVARVMSEQQVSLLIHGHTHRPAEHDFELSGNSMKRIVLGDWDETGWMLRCDESGNSLIEFKL